MHVVVTGAAGRLARVLLPRLLAHPDITRVTGIDRRPCDLRHPRFEAVMADIRSPRIGEQLNGADVLVHMAFVLMGGGLGRRRHRRELIRAINVGGSIGVFEAAYEAGLSRLVFLSSAVVYGAWPDNPPLIGEDRPLRAMPGFAYAEDKVAVEHWLDDFERAHPELAVLRLRPHVILGPQAHPLLRLMPRQPFYPVFHGPEALTQCVWEEDVAAAVEAALFTEARGAFNLAAQPPMSFRDMLRHTGQRPLPVPLALAGFLHRLAWLATPAVGEPGWVQGMRHSLAVSSERAETVLGWQARYDTCTALRALADRERGRDGGRDRDTPA